MGLRIRREVRVTGIKSEAAQRNILCAALFVAGSLSSRPSKAYAQLLQVNFATFNIGPVINLASKGNPGFPKFEGIFVVFSSYDTIFKRKSGSTHRFTTYISSGEISIIIIPLSPRKIINLVILICRFKSSSIRVILSYRSNFKEFIFILYTGICRKSTLFVNFNPMHDSIDSYLIIFFKDATFYRVSRYF